MAQKLTAEEAGLDDEEERETKKPRVSPSPTPSAASLPQPTIAAEPEASPKDAERSLTVFVSGLPANITESELAEHFSGCGQVLGCSLMKRDSGSVGFVQFESERSLHAAFKKNGTAIDGKRISVQPKRSAGGAEAKVGRMEKNTSVFVKFLNGGNPSAHTIKEAFKICGDVVDVRCQPGKDYCFVEFTSIEAAQLAIKLSDPRFQVHYSRSSSENREQTAEEKAKVAASKARPATMLVPRTVKRKK